MQQDGRRVEEIPVRELAGILKVTEAQAAAIQDFIRQAGGIEQARDAVNLYGRLTKAA